MIVAGAIGGVHSEMSANDAVVSESGFEPHGAAAF